MYNLWGCAKFIVHCLITLDPLNSIVELNKPQIKTPKIMKYFIVVPDKRTQPNYNVALQLKNIQLVPLVGQKGGQIGGLMLWLCYLQNKGFVAHIDNQCTKYADDI